MWSPSDLRRGAHGHWIIFISGVEKGRQKEGATLWTGKFEKLEIFRLWHLTRNHPLWNDGTEGWWTLFSPWLIGLSGFNLKAPSLIVNQLTRSNKTNAMNQSAEIHALICRSARSLMAIEAYSGQTERRAGSGCVAMCVCGWGVCTAHDQRRQRGRRRSDDARTVKTFGDWLDGSAWEWRHVFVSTRQETHQGIKRYFLHLKTHFSFSSFCVNHWVKNETSQVLLGLLSFARLSQYAAKPVDLDVEFPITIRWRWAPCRKPEREQERALQ